MTARVVVRPMPGTTDTLTWTVGGGYWRWRCEACTNLGHWTTADNAHDDGRAHARNCAALKYALVAQRVKEIDATPEGGDVGAAIFELARAL